MNRTRQNSEMNVEDLLMRIRKADPADDLLQRIELRIAKKSVVIPLRTIYRMAASFVLIAVLECTMIVVSSSDNRADVAQQVDNQIYE